MNATTHRYPQTTAEAWKQAKAMTDDELLFTRDDATWAAYHGAQIKNPKTGQYIQLAIVCAQELKRRGRYDYDAPTGKWTVYYADHDLDADDGSMIRATRLDAARTMENMRGCGYRLVTCEPSTNN